MTLSPGHMMTIGSRQLTGGAEIVVTGHLKTNRLRERAMTVEQRPKLDLRTTSKSIGGVVDVTR